MERAEKLYDFGALPKSIMQGKSNIYGAVGEVVTLDYFADRSDYVGCKDYDLTIDGVKIDVKSKRTTVTPKPFYSAAVSAHNTVQQCDGYYFVRVLEDCTKAFLLGYMSKDEFYRLATYHKKGERGGKGFVYKGSCYECRIDQLHQIE